MISAANLSPEHWPLDIRERVESREADSWFSAQSRSVTGQSSLICATASPIALQAGIVTLEQGGTAADAAVVIALTQVATKLGSVVSYAGVMSCLYHDARTKEVSSLDAGFNSYQNESEPLSIPGFGKDNPPDHLGRQTLVPGFMAGVEAFHKRFGKLPLASLFQPAIWYAEKGITINSWLEHYFQSREIDLGRTREGTEFLHQAGINLPVAGDLFVQGQLARTLMLTSELGANYFYTGAWAEHFVELVQKAGGKVSIEDLANYKATWTKPQKTEAFGHEIYCAGLPNQIARQLFPALHLAEELKFAERANYWEDPLVLRDLQRIFDLTDFAPFVSTPVKSFLESHGIDCSPAAQLTKQYAAAVAPFLEQLWNPHQYPASNHSDSIVVIDKFGNVAAMTHSINTQFWGGTGIVVDGVPLPDAAGFQQQRLAGIKSGERLPHEMPQTICFHEDKVVLATAAIGASMIPETIRILIATIGKGMRLEAIQPAAPLIYNYMHLAGIINVPERGIVIPKDRYSLDFQKRRGTSVEKIHKIDRHETDSFRGTVAAVSVDEKTYEKHSAETEGMLIFAEAL